MSTINTQDEACKARYLKVRVGFVSQGTTLNAWCANNGTHIQNVRAAFFGQWNGPQASALIDRVSMAAGVQS